MQTLDPKLVPFMYEIEMHEMTPAFHACWLAAGNHLNRQVDGGIQSWLRADPYPPFLEHLSFRLGNQLFFVRLVDVDGEVRGPGNPRGAISAARIANGIACELPMKRSRSGAWAADLPGWGLIDGHTGQPLNPAALVTDEKIEMSAWELQDVAVQIVRDDLTKAGFKLNSWQSNPEIDPSLWFVGKSGGPEWVVVRTVTYPVPRATTPANWEAIAANVARISKLGHFASVSLVSAEQLNAPEDASRIPLWRGHGLHAIYEGLERVSHRIQPPCRIWSDCALLPPEAEGLMGSLRSLIRNFDIDLQKGLAQVAAGSVTFHDTDTHRVKLVAIKRPKKLKRSALCAGVLIKVVIFAAVVLTSSPNSGQFGVGLSWL